MRGKFITGALIGTAVGMMFMPEMDRTTKRRIKKTAKFMRNAAENVFDGMRDRGK